MVMEFHPYLISPESPSCSQGHTPVSAFWTPRTTVGRHLGSSLPVLEYLEAPGPQESDIRRKMKRQNNLRDVVRMIPQNLGLEPSLMAFLCYLLDFCSPTLARCYGPVR